MKRSTERILTTHTGSLPRPDELTELLQGHEQREARASAGFDRQVEQAVRDIVRKQVENGIDIPNDGEMSKVGYSTYITERVTGYEGEARAPIGGAANVDNERFPDWAKARAQAGLQLKRPVCTGPITWQGDALVQQDIANLKAALQGVPTEDAFMTAAAPGVVWVFLENDYYPTHEAYVFAIADAMKHEYKAIVDAGFVLQLDAPDVGLGWPRFLAQGQSIDDFRKVVQMHIEAINHATAGIPSDRIRFHLCWGNFEGPHVNDIPLGRIIDLVYQANADAISFEGANPRHEHEWQVFKDQKLPEGKILMPGVVDSTTNFVEHPELIAQRIVRYAELVGKENVIAGTDCGFATFARSQHTVYPTVTWAKFQAMADGARIASKQLWG